MTDMLQKPCTAFEGGVLLSSGALIEVALAVKLALERGTEKPVLVFNDATGAIVDLDLPGTKVDIAARLSQPEAAAEPRRRGRPKLGVVAREVTLLPRHWQWLAAQPGGASVTLRRLVARPAQPPDEPKTSGRKCRWHHRFMSALGRPTASGRRGHCLPMTANASAGGCRLAHPSGVYATRLAFGDG